MLDQFLAARALTGISSRLSYLGVGSGRELLYAHMFTEGLRANKIDCAPLYPVRGAANWSLLYLLLRLTTETSLTRVLELGAGQSTLLLDAVSRMKPLSITTLETDPDWAARIGSKVSHPVVTCKLTTRKIHGHHSEAIDGYPDGAYDLVLVDGPMGGKPRRSRWASLEVLERQLGDEFVVVFDDAERRGEQDTIKEFLRQRPKARKRLTFGAKCQCVVYTPIYGEVSFF